MVHESKTDSLFGFLGWQTVCCLFQLSCTWDDVKLANFVDYERIHHSPNLVFRWKLLEATLAMQSALGVQDLGRLHSKTITDSRGVTILVTVQHIQEPKTVQVRFVFSLISNDSYH